MEDSCDVLCLDQSQAEALRAATLSPEAAESAARRAKALGDASRVTLAASLRQGGELCVCDVAWIAGMAQNLASHHLRAMREAGVVQARREGKMAMYTLSAYGHRLLAATVDHPLPLALPLAGTGGSAEASGDACCDSDALETCCEASAKGECCGEEAVPSSCGCISGVPLSTVRDG